MALTGCNRGLNIHQAEARRGRCGARSVETVEEVWASEDCEKRGRLCVRCFLQGGQD